MKHMTKRRDHRDVSLAARPRWPAPDPSTRVDLVVVRASMVPAGAPAKRLAAVVAGVGAAAMVAAATSTAFDQPDLPVVSRAAVGGLGAVLVLVGATTRRPLSRPRVAPVAPVAAAQPPVAPVDLPSLTGQISGVLSDLRRRYGIVYRTRTWIEDMLPAYGATLADPVLARDLLGAAALDAGGIRADVGRLAEAHDRDDMVSTASAILSALQGVLAACDVPSDLLPAPLPSDPSSWPPSRC